MHDLTDQPCGYDESDALRIARWCWPGRTWREGPNGVDDLVVESAAGFHFKDDGKSLLVTRAADVHAAESVLIERGLAEEYGSALAYELGMGEMGDGGPISTADRDYVRAEQVAYIATATLPARVRAMAAVIRAQSATELKETKTP